MKNPVVGPPPKPRDPAHILDPELELLAHWMDTVFHIPGLGIRFGLDSLLGLIPGLGDTATSLVSLYILRAATQYRVPRITLVRMAANVAVDYVLGCVPILGDAFDLYWKANQRNVALLRQHVRANRTEELRARRSDWFFLAGLVLILLLILVGSITTAYFLVRWTGQILFPTR